MKFLFVFLGGGIGSMARYAIWRWFSNHNFELPYATFIANMLSCLILGYLIGLQLKLDIPENLRLLLLIGFCGGFSTFSTFGFETFQMMESGSIQTAMGYILISVLVCWVFIYLGIKMA